ncbi:unnamed protein product [Blepharisma stoltei]|uniref:Uncharacterized protein n=1 Tax=Blepharisma stoltei TaxID=1481888 RepID=A0AAU9IYY7_9CILI|nr:unnamed protein product [Blepharisma stoltei]
MAQRSSNYHSYSDFKSKTLSNFKSSNSTPRSEPSSRNHWKSFRTELRNELWRKKTPVKLAHYSDLSNFKSQSPRTSPFDKYRRNPGLFYSSISSLESSASSGFSSPKRSATQIQELLPLETIIHVQEALESLDSSSLTPLYSKQLLKLGSLIQSKLKRF